MTSNYIIFPFNLLKHWQSSKSLPRDAFVRLWSWVYCSFAIPINQVLSRFHSSGVNSKSKDDCHYLYWLYNFAIACQYMCWTFLMRWLELSPHMRTKTASRFSWPLSRKTSSLRLIFHRRSRISSKSVLVQRCLRPNSSHYSCSSSGPTFPLQVSSSSTSLLAFAFSYIFILRSAQCSQSPMIYKYIVLKIIQTSRFHLTHLFPGLVLI